MEINNNRVSNDAANSARLSTSRLPFNGRRINQVPVGARAVTVPDVGMDEDWVCCMTTLTYARPCQSVGSRRARTTATSTGAPIIAVRTPRRSEEHTSELQSRPHLVCRLL